MGENCSLIHKKVVFKPIIVIFNGLNSPYQVNIKQTFEILRKGFYLTYTRFKPMIENNNIHLERDVKIRLNSFVKV